MGLPLDETENRRIYSITEITREIKQVLESSFPPIWIEGEISNFKRHSSGHMYLVLKDESAQIPAVMWRGHNSRLFFTPQDGMKVIAFGNLSLYEKRGAYQFEITKLQPAGIGDLQLAFEQLKQKLREEGLFNPEFKKPIPLFPENIGIVTSPTGAAIRDMVSVLSRRFPSVQIILAPVRVQGDGAAEEIAQAIKDFNEYNQIDILIIGRGGGSMEDLWPFNEEVVARAIFNSNIPIISAVGHEVDFSISDFVSDLRAPTPSAAAELAVRDRVDLSESIKNSLNRVYRTLLERIAYYQEKVNHLQNSYALRKPSDVIKQQQQRLDELIRSSEIQFQHIITSRKQEIASLEKQLLSLSPDSILKRGYSLCYKDEDGKLIKSVSEVSIDDKMKIQFYKGQLKSKVEEIIKENLESDKNLE